MPYCDHCGRQLSLADPDRRLILTLVFAGFSAVFYYLGMREPGAGFLGLSASVGGIYAYSRRG